MRAIAVPTDRISSTSLTRFTTSLNPPIFDVCDVDAHDLVGELLGLEAIMGARSDDGYEFGGHVTFSYATCAIEVNPDIVKATPMVENSGLQTNAVPQVIWT